MVGQIDSQADVSLKNIINSSMGKKEVVGRRNVEFRCLDITEPQDGNVDKPFVSSVLADFRETAERAKCNLGYAINFDIDYSDLDEVCKSVINNVGDPFIEINFPAQSRRFEVSVLDWFARLWEIEKDDYWGYVTNGGTEGNLHGLLIGRELLPDGILYTSKESHYTIFKIARMYRMECVKIDTLVTGEIDCDHFKSMLLQNKDKPAIINVNIGTTMKGGIDDLDLLTQTLEQCGFQRDRFYIHCDSALYGLILPLLTTSSSGGPKLTFKKPIGSISVSGQKLVGCPMPCGIQMTRIEYISALSTNVEYLGTRDCTITCSRNGHAPIYLWYALSRKGYRGLKQDFERCLRNAKYLKDLLKDAGVSVMLNEMSNTLVFERPRDEDFILRWQLPTVGNVARLVVMPSDTVEKIDIFYQELVEKRSRWFDQADGAGADQPPCVAAQIGEANCLCYEHRLK